MGQRHQAYLRLPAVYYNENNPNNRGELTIGLHHQWLYGFNAVYALYRYIKWLKAGESNLKYISQDPQGAFNASYSFDHEIGYFHGVHTLMEAEVKDPTTADNNNGITIIDIASMPAQKPRYCFMFLGDDFQETCKNHMPNFEPLSVEQWLTCHYPDWQESNWHESKEVESWMIDRVGYITKHAEVLEKSRVELIFPAMMAKVA